MEPGIDFVVTGDFNMIRNDETRQGKNIWKKFEELELIHMGGIEDTRGGRKIDHILATGKERG